MPLFEYHCEACNKTFEKITKVQKDNMPCPDCGKASSKAVSVFAASSCNAPSGSGFG